MAKKIPGKRILLSLLLFYCLALLEVSFAMAFAIKGVAPNFVLIALLLLSIFTKSRDFLQKHSGFLAGFFLDVFSPLPLGTKFFSLGLTIILAKKFLQNFKKVDFLSALLFFFLATLLFHLLTPLFSLIFGFFEEGLSSFTFTFNSSLLISLAYNSLLGLFLWVLLKSFKK